MTVTSTKTVQEYKQICDKVKNLNSEIRFVGVINERGRLIADGMKESIKSLENPKDDEILYMELALRVKMRKEFDKQLGPVNFAMASREKSLAISIPIQDNVLYVVAEPYADYAKLPKKILGIIHNNI